MNRAAWIAATAVSLVVSLIVGLGVLRARLGGERPGTGPDAREVLEVGFLPVT
jgi:hypothetical protein